MGQRSTTRNEKFIAAPPQTVYTAFTTPLALEHWMAPGNMRARVHAFDLRKGGSYQMSLYYPEQEKDIKGKSGQLEDRYTATFLELDPPKKIVTSVQFESGSPDFAEPMIMDVTLEEKNGGTQVIIVFKNIPSAIRTEDNEAGTASSLEKLALYVESGG